MFHNISYANRLGALATTPFVHPRQPASSAGLGNPTRAVDFPGRPCNLRPAAAGNSPRCQDVAAAEEFFARKASPGQTIQTRGVRRLALGSSPGNQPGAGSHAQRARCAINLRYPAKNRKVQFAFGSLQATRVWALPSSQYEAFEILLRAERCVGAARKESCGRLVYAHD